MGADVDEDSLALLDEGRAPELKALRMHSGTVYRWNRPCYGFVDGKPHLRIENRVLPSGPTVLDEIASGVFFWGLMHGMPDVHEDISKVMTFDDAQVNFFVAAQSGLRARFRWVGGQSVTARDLILEELLPVARAGLKSAGIVSRDIDRYLGVFEERVSADRTGSQWILKSYSDMKAHRKDVVLRALTAATVNRQWKGIPGHEWTPARVAEGRTMKADESRIEESMTTDLFTIHPDDPFELVTNLMEWKHIRHVPVEDELGRVVGLVSSLHALEYLNRKEGRTSRPASVRSMMDTNPVTVTPETLLLDAIGLMH